MECPLPRIAVSVFVNSRRRRRARVSRSDLQHFRIIPGSCAIVMTKQRGGRSPAAKCDFAQGGPYVLQWVGTDVSGLANARRDRRLWASSLWWWGNDFAAALGCRIIP